MPTVLAILAEGFEEIEAVTPTDLLRRAGAEVIVAAVGSDLLVKGRSGITVRADVLLNQLELRPFDCLFLPGGPQVKVLRLNQQVLSWVRLHVNANAYIAAICAAPLVLNDLGLLKDKRYTAHFSAESELPHILADLKVVTDGKLITARGAGTSLHFGLKIIELLFSPKVAREISASVCA